MRKLKLFFTACALLLCAGLQAKVNVTSQYLSDADLSSLNGWGNPGRTDWRTNGAVNVVEFWNWSSQFNFSQTANLPAGYYRLAVNAFYRNSWGGDGTNDNMAWIFAGDKRQNVIALNSMNELSGYEGSNDLYRAATAFSQGKFSNEFDFNVVSSEGTVGVEIGFKGTCPNGGWCILGPVTLWKYTVEDYQSDFNEKKTTAQSLYDSPMNATVLLELQTAANATFTTVDDIIEGGRTLEVAIENALRSIGIYENTKNALDTYGEKAATMNEEGQAAYNVAAIQDIQDAYDARTLSEDQSAVIAATFIAAYLAQGTDMTEHITNPSFETGNTSGWTYTKSIDDGAKQNSNSTYTMSNVDGDYLFNIWDAGNPISQTIEGLPSGAYNLSAFMGTDAGHTLELHGNDVVGTATSAGPTMGVFVSVEDIVITDGKLTIQAVTADNHWYKVDDFHLTHVRDLPETELYEFALDAAKAIAEGTIPTAAYLALQETIAANTLTEGTPAQYEAATSALNSATEKATSLQEPYATWLQLKTRALELATGHESITGAIGKVAQYVETLTTVNDLTEANTMTTNMVANYTAWYELKNRADELVAVSNNNAEANATLQEAITTQYNNISTLAQEINNADITTSTGLLVTKALVNSLINTTIPNATSTLKEAMTTYVKTAEPTNDECFDLTFLIVNPHFTEGEGVTAIPTGWTLESGGITEHRLATHNFEAYHQQFNLSQTIPDLPKGTYKVTLQGFARHDGTDKDKTNLYCGIVNQPIKNISDEYSTTSLFHNPMEGTYCPLWSAVEINYDTEYTRDGQTVYQPNGMTGSYYWFQETNPLTEQPYYTNEVQTLITEDGDLKIGFKCETLTDWVIWDNFHLYYYGSAIAVTLDEATGTSYSEDIDNANVTLKKTIYQGWNTIVIPFEVEEISAFNCTDLYEFTGYDESTTTLMFNPVTAIEPNVPYLLKASAGITDAIIFNGVTIKAATDLTTGEGGFNFVGTYQEALVADGDYILGEKDGAAGFYRSSGGNKVKAYRAYMKRIAEDDGHFARIAISLNGETTAIDTINGQPIINNAAIYNLSGQQVKKAQKGIYIQNGKKVVIK